MKDSKEYSRMVTFYHNVRENLGSETNRDSNIIDELLNIEKNYDVKVSYNITGKLFIEHPEFVKKIYEAGHEVSFYSDNNFPAWDSKIKTLYKPVGYHSLKTELNSELSEIFRQNSFLWNAEIDEHEEPYFIYKGLIRLPIADDELIEKDKINLEKWIQKFLFFLESRKYFGYGLHDYVSDPQKYIEAYESVIKLALKHNVLIVTFSQAADLFRRSGLVNHYNLTANNWNKETRVLYRTKRFQELIRNEVIKINSPVIADLGSGRGALSESLKDVTAKIYCIDNSREMMNGIQTDPIVQSMLGEITATTLAENSVDFIICARIIEYIYYPELVANEIKRIGKLGAKFFVTFPAYINGGPSNYREIPDKIRKHFISEEVLAWANQIGSGKLIGIQYDDAEPKDINDENRYRKIEEEQPAIQNPTNWVFIGTIENKKLNHTNFKSVSLNSFKFNIQQNLKTLI